MILPAFKVKDLKIGLNLHIQSNQIYQIFFKSQTLEFGKFAAPILFHKTAFQLFWLLLILIDIKVFSNLGRVYPTYCEF